MKKKLIFKIAEIEMLISVKKKWPWSKPVEGAVMFNSKEEFLKLIDVIKAHEKRLNYLHERLDELSQPTGNSEATVNTSEARDLKGGD